MNTIDITTLPRHEAESLPWVGASIPPDYELTREGVFKLKGDDRDRISGPIWVTAKTRNHRHDDWGIVLNWLDHDGQLHERAFPARRFYESRSTLPQDLATEGLPIVSGQERNLVAYLTNFETDARLQSVNRLGWLDSETERLLFVLPGRERTRVLGQGNTQTVIFQPERNLPSLESMQEQGSLEEWKSNVARYCRGNPVLLLALCAGFAAPLLRFLETEGGVFHIFGRSSTGKTTALQVGASVWGCGADPGASAITHIRRWNTTTNALEATAAAHNDTLLLLDEIGSSNAADFGKMVYDLVSGQGKSRLTKDAELREQRFARVLALSTGEISLAQIMEQDQRRRTLEGHRTRFVDVPTKTNIIANPHGLDARVFAARLKQNCGRYYGTAGPRFVQAVIDDYGEPQALQLAIRDGVDNWTARLKGGRRLACHQERALQRFALVLTAGLLAAEFEILPVHSAELKAAVESVVQAWLEQDQSEGERGLLALREFMLRHESRFGDADDPYSRPPNLVGYRDRRTRRFLFTEEGFREACGGHNPEAVFQELRAQGYAASNDPGHRKTRATIKERSDKPSRPWLYGVRDCLRGQQN